MLVVYGSIQSDSMSLWARIADRNKMQHLERKTTLCEGNFKKVSLIYIRKGNTSVRACSMSTSRSATSKARTLPVSMTRGITLAAIRIAIKREAIGSKPVQP